MSLKDDIKSVKKEIHTEEKFLEGFVKFERFFKKNKLIIIIASVVVVLGFVTVGVTDYLRAENQKMANIAFNKVLENPKDQAAIAVLKEKNNKLYEISLYLKAQKENKISDTKIKYLKELSDYQRAIAKQNVDSLSALSMKSNFLLKEFAIFNKALILTENKKYVDAKETLRLIPQTSKVYELVKLLNHYLLTKV